MRVEKNCLNGGLMRATRRSAKNNKVPKNIDKKRKVGEAGDGCTIAARYSSLFYNSLYSLLFCCLLEMGK
jgi:hypothetical protein